MKPEAKDVGAGPGLPVLGDDIVIAPSAGVLGAVIVGNRVKIQANNAAFKDAPADVLVASAVSPSPGPRPIERDVSARPIRSAAPMPAGSA